VRIVLRLFLVLFTCFCLMVGGFFFWFYTGLGLPRLEELQQRQLDQTSKVYAADGTLIAELHGEQNRENVALEEVSQDLQNAVISIEDQRFWQHHGIDWYGIARAAWTNVVKREVVQGASTITQQFVKNTLTGQERTYWRKVQEASLANQVENRYSKEKILEMYLNDVYFGQGCYGVKTACKVFFGKEPRDITLAESALLAGLIRAPNYYSPYFHAEQALKRRNLVLDKMQEQGYVDAERAMAAKMEPIQVMPVEESAPSVIAPYFVEYVKNYLKQSEELKSKFDNYSAEDIIYRGGLRIYTTLDLNLQQLAENAIDSILNREGDPTAALCAVEPGTGYIKAMVGGKDFTQQQYNIAAQGGRQPGSAFKVFVLTAALSNGISLNKTYDSSPCTLEFPDGTKWKVTNSDGSGRGTITLREATVRSVNVVYARLMRDVGPQRVVEFARVMGITSPLDPNPAIAIGGLTYGVNPLEMASAFGTLANNGIRTPPICVTRVTDANGKVLLENFPQGKRVIREDVAAKVNEVLQQAVSSGTGRSAIIGRPQAGKTGTTDNFADAWFCGYTPDLSCAVWVGYPQGLIPMTSVHGITVFGGTFPAQIWKAFMGPALAGLPKTPFPGSTDNSSDEERDDLVTVELCADSLLLATPNCPNRIRRSFRRGEEPTEYCNLHGAPSPGKATVPSVIGMSASAAAAALESAGFHASVSHDYGTAPTGTVMSQSPAAGAQATVGSTVSIVVCDGPKPVSVVPGVVGSSETSAVTTIQNAGFKPSVNYIFDPAHAGVVVDQHPGSGATASPGSTVYILVGKSTP
jgi:penicillin-binding protein 1A